VDNLKKAFIRKSSNQRNCEVVGLNPYYQPLVPQRLPPSRDVEDGNEFYRYQQNFGGATHSEPQITENSNYRRDKVLTESNLSNYRNGDDGRLGNVSIDLGTIGYLKDMINLNSKLDGTETPLKISDSKKKLILEYFKEPNNSELPNLTGNCFDLSER
jgi:hypothetical protein